ncbi:MAG: nucleotidyltransferase family protein [Alphaproteobacteria bacterium]|nr:nucleotidyltransferase family protein [Alphaproteobacteria bacterium]MBU1525493.1 nucleotidyltransferase family protein [Alphaproteobacteria bacterium]MBU2115979.1 nucleotidyltransferase family protein [Alphaproteobacteria bacterium]MBU2350895.1 nucleotidyltransferase family protein [Alphaproteobacteria bacterium]MBU2381724.1 nucleotidyltransferase family protein [Alphaproteobacteria bacterium]
MSKAGDQTDQTRARQFGVLARLCADAGSGRRVDELARAAREVRQWDGLEDMIVHHRVVGIAHAAMMRCADAFPLHLRQALAKRASALAVTNLSGASETVKLQLLLEEAGIEPVFFKGATLAQRAYGTLATKQSRDVDFIVPAADVVHAVSLLEQRGYRLELPRPGLTGAQWRSMTTFGMEVQMVHPQSHIRVEPHWRLTQTEALISTQDLCASAGKAWDAIGDVPIRTFHPDDLFAYLCVHGAAAGWFRLKWLTDLNALTDEAAPGELDRLYRHAATRGAGASAALALSMCGTVFGREVPSGVQRRIDGSRRLRRLKALYLRNLEEVRVSPWRAFQGALLLASAEGCLGTQLRRMMICPEDAIDHPLPRPLHFMYYIIRVPAWLGRWLVPPRKALSA